jgi:geranylgeranyl pyrophosphate synthase
MVLQQASKSVGVCFQEANDLLKILADPQLYKTAQGTKYLNSSQSFQS